MWWFWSFGAKRTKEKKAPGAYRVATVVSRRYLDSKPTAVPPWYGCTWVELLCCEGWPSLGGKRMCRSCMLFGALVLFALHGPPDVVLKYSLHPDDVMAIKDKLSASVLEMGVRLTSCILSRTPVGRTMCPHMVSICVRVRVRQLSRTLGARM
jgi:hypothetical protein